MYYSNIIERVFYRTMYITPAGHESIAQIIKTKLMKNGLRMDDDGDGDGGDIFPDILEKPATPYNYGNNVKVIPVHGVLGYRVSNLERVCGVADYQVIRGWVQNAANDDNIDTIVFDFNSPGGEVTGCEELANYIIEVGEQKNTIAFSDTLMCSAAQWLGAACNESYCTPTATVGSVGVYSYFVTSRKAYEDAGLKVELFTSGDLKGMGVPGTDLTDDQKKYLDSEIKRAGAKFRTYMTARRGNIPEYAMRGQGLSGEEAVQVGMVDGLVNCFEDIFSIE